LVKKNWGFENILKRVSTKTGRVRAGQATKRNRQTSKQKKEKKKPIKTPKESKKKL